MRLIEYHRVHYLQIDFASATDQFLIFTANCNLHLIRINGVIFLAPFEMARVDSVNKCCINPNYGRFVMFVVKYENLLMNHELLIEKCSKFNSQQEKS